MVKATPANIVPAKTSSSNVVPTSNTKTTTNNRLRPVQLEEGVKRISQESIENIRSDGNVFNINVDDKPTGTKSHLPGSPQESKYSPTKQVRNIFYIINYCPQQKVIIGLTMQCLK